MDFTTFEKFEAFVQNIPETSRLAFVTSGGTLINFDRENRIKIENYSSGIRGAICAEELLINNYYVIFLYNEDSFLPFLHNLNIKDFIGNTLVENDQIYYLENYQEKFIHFKRLYEKYSPYLFLVPFLKEQEYLAKKEVVEKKISVFEERCIIFLFAVNNYLMKITDSYVLNKLTIHLQPVDNHIDKIKRQYDKKCVVVTYQTGINADDNTLNEMSKKMITKDRVDYVVTSLEENRHDKVILMNLNEKFEIFKEKEDQAVEEKLVKLLISLHNVSIQKWKYIS